MKRPPRRALACVVAAALALGGCPPPPDIPAPGERTDAPGPEPADPAQAPAGGGGTAAPKPADGSGPAAAGVRTSAGSAPVVFEELRGGVRVPRCPACGEVQPDGSTSCRACGQAISAWRMETICLSCTGEGRCRACGEDRVCLACDGAGKCGLCGGTGEVSGGAKCPDCNGAKQCSACRGDGRREAAAGDFPPSEGTVPGACPTCIDGSGLCPECGSTGKDVAGGECVTCAGKGVCPDCAGEGACAACGADGECAECAGAGRVVRNGAPRGPDERTRRLRTSAGSPLVVRIEAPPTAAGVRAVTAADGRPVSQTLQKSQLDPLSWVLAVRAFPPGWDGRTQFEPREVANFRMDLAQTAEDASLWPIAARQLALAMTADPSQAQAARVRLSALETKRSEDWAKRADAAQKTGDRARATVLLEMVRFASRGSPLARRSELQVLGLRKDRVAEWEKLSDAERVRRLADGRAAAERALARARFRMDRAQRLLARATGEDADAAASEASFQRAAWSAWAARRTVETAAAAWPPGEVEWPRPPADVVTESRHLLVTVLRDTAARAVAGGRFGVAERHARRALAASPDDEALRNLLAQAQLGLARSGVLQGSPPTPPR